MPVALPEFRQVSLADAKAWARIDSTDWDAKFTGLIASATTHYQEATGRILEASGWEYKGPRWESRGVAIPAAPVRAVSAVTYLDPDGAEQTLPAAEWTWHRTEWGAVVLWTSAFSAPSLYEVGEVVTIAFTAGYDDESASGSGDDADLVASEEDRTAIKMLVAHWHRNAEAAALGVRPEPVPDHYRAIVARRRVYR